jgi:glycosyltransferase involved in cell wall biosynthesis
MSTKVAVIMPVYNKAPFLRETILSVLNQTYSNFDLLIVDDCSTDKSLEIIEGFTDTRIKIVKNLENLGTSKTGNILFEKAKDYDYAIRCDADDIFDLNRFDLLIQFMEQHKIIDICSSQLEYFGKQTGKVNLPLNDKEIKARLFFTSGVSQGAAIFRMSAINKISPPIYKNFESNVGEDWMLFVELSSKIQFANLSQTLVKYRIHDNNVTSDKSSLIENRKFAIHFVLNEYNIPLKLENAYQLLIGLNPNCEYSKIRIDLLQLIKHIKQNYLARYGNKKSINTELKIRVRKAICILSDKKSLQALLLLLRVPKYINYPVFKYCLINLFKK